MQRTAILSLDCDKCFDSLFLKSKDELTEKNVRSKKNLFLKL